MTSHSVNTCNNTHGFAGSATPADTINALAGILGGLPATVVHTFVAWQKRSDDRARLQEMPEYLLKDVGLTREQADHEISKPFWRP